MSKVVFREEAYAIIGACMEVHNEMGRGLSEILYKDALELEFEMRGIPFEREKAFNVFYKTRLLPRKYYTDFVAFKNIILEIKATGSIIDPFIQQTLNYMAIAKSPLGIIIDFGGTSLLYKRLVL